jgi:ABC-2 type transport system ATP-binding protein
MPAIRAEGLAKAFGGLAAVSGLSLEVAEGELVGLVGPDGAGKTTVLRLLAGVLRPSAGDAWVAGFHVVRQAEELKEHIGYVSQRFGLYPDLTVMENLDFYADLYGVPRGERAGRAARLLEFSGLAPFTERLAGALSGGMKQKLGLACALIHTPKVLLLDEPTNGVDPVSRRDFWRILNQLLRERVTILVSTAYLDEAERCSRVALMHGGRLLAAAPPDEVKRLLRGAVIEVRSADPRRAAAELRAAGGFDSVGLFGDRVHALAREAEGAERARAVLARAGLEVREVRRVAPSLEDVFLSVLQEQEASGGAAGRS